MAETEEERAAREAAEARQREYDSLCSQKSQNDAEQAEVQSVINDLDDKITKMQTAYNNLDAAKEGLKSIRSVIQCWPDFYESVWKGDVATAIYDACKKDGYHEASYTQYIDAIDEIQDALNLKLTELENEKLRQQGILGELIAWGNSLWTRIQNFFN